MINIYFKYGNQGKGKLELWSDRTKLSEIDARTGSINSSGKLVNAIQPGEWYIKDSPIDTINPSMIWDGEGWYASLYTPEGVRTSFGIHPDGGKPQRGNGTKGCIGTEGSAFIFRDTIKKIISESQQDEIVVYISKKEESNA